MKLPPQKASYYMSLYKRILFSLFILVSFSETARADCHFIRLIGYQLTQRADVFAWGQISPLIVLEAGRSYYLTPEGQLVIEISSERGSNLYGEQYYIPQHLIDKNNSFSLRMMVIEKDEDTPNDLILPLKEYPISLASGLFTSNTRRINAFFYPFSDNNLRPRNEQSYEFEIEKNSQICSLDSKIGRNNDRHYRLENDLKRVRLRIKYYDELQVSGARDNRYYQLPEIDKFDYNKAIKISGQFASVNSSELLSLGRQLETLKHLKNYPIVWKEFLQLVQHLLSQTFTATYVENKVRKSIRLPSLGFHPKWKELTHQPVGFQPPKHWKIITN